jgi:hypothetical protein
LLFALKKAGAKEKRRLAIIDELLRDRVLEATAGTYNILLKSVDIKAAEACET